MAEVISLVLREDAVADQSTVALTAYTDGFSVFDWHPAAPGADGMVRETLGLRVKGTSDNDIAAKIQALDLKVLQAQRYTDTEYELYGVWLRVQTGTEGSARNALVRRMSTKVNQRLAGPVFDVHHYIVDYTLGIERYPYWEGTIGHTITPTANAISAIGGSYNYTAPVMGDVSARLGKASLTLRTVAGFEQNIDINKVWLGFRTTRFGSPVNWQPYWTLYEGTKSNGTATVADGSTTPGYTAEVTFTPPSLVRRVEQCVYGALPYPSLISDQRGKFQAILRARVTDGTTTCRVRLSDGYYGDTALNVRSRVVVDGTDYHFYDLGRVQFPGSGRQTILNDCAIQIDAERIAGLGKLRLDCMVRIPCDEGFVYANGGAVVGVNKFITLEVKQLGNGETIATGYAADGSPSYAIEHTMTGGVPSGTGYIFAAAEGTEGALITNVINGQFTAYPRYTTLRGASGE